MQVALKLFGTDQAYMALQAMPARVRFLHVRKALSKAGGIIRDSARTFVRKATGLLAKSLSVKPPVIPDSSYNKAHHGRPAYVIVGPKRKAGRFLRINKKNALRGFGAAQKALVAERKRLASGKIGKPLERERAAVAATLKTFADAVYRNPSRYAHLVEKGHARGKGRSAAPPHPFLAPAIAASRGRVIASVAGLLSVGVEQEARSLSSIVVR